LKHFETTISTSYNLSCSGPVPIPKHLCFATLRADAGRRPQQGFPCVAGTAVAQHIAAVAGAEVAQAAQQLGLQIGGSSY